MKIFPEEFFDLLGLYQIMDTEVELTPKLIKKSRKGEVQLAAPTIEAVMPKIEVPDMPLGQCHFISQD